MSGSNLTICPSTDNFTAILKAALMEYQRVTGQDLDAHPFAAQLDTCRCSETVSKLLRTQAQAFSKFRRSDEKLLAWLDPTVHVLFTVSVILSDGIGLPFFPARMIFTGIAVLLGAVRDVAASRIALIQLFERLHFFLKRLGSYTRVPLTNELTELLGKIMAQLLSVLALSTKAMKDGRMKQIVKRLLGKTDVEEALLRLDMLTKEECSMTVARNLEVAHRVDANVTTTRELTQGIDNSVKVIKWVARGMDNNVRAAKDATDELKRNQLQEKLLKWLSPPDPSINHNLACDTQHDGTARWFIKGARFEDWKQNGSLLWICGNPGSGKSILCSSIIEDVKRMQGATALIAYYYFDFKDAAKRGVRGLLTSLLFQLADCSDNCWVILSQLHKAYGDGSRQPSNAALSRCLKNMLDISGQVPIFVILDALDECPSDIGTPSARERVLHLVEDLAVSNYDNLYMCITSRPEQDIRSVLNPLTPASCRVSLHKEAGQREDINSYIRSFVHTDRAMRRWKREDKELVISTLSKRANGMFRWVFCQLDTLRRCFPPSIRETLNELPTTLDETYERALQGIPKEKMQHAHRLFQCLVAAIRPLRVEELAEILAIKFDDRNAVPNLVESWRPEDPEEAVLSACSTLIMIIDKEGSKIVQFSHFSVKEFLTSGRLLTTDVEHIRRYHISLDAAHTVLARACLTVLLHLDERVDKKSLRTFPLAFYAAQHWVDHAKFGDVAFRIQDAMEHLFNPSKPYLAAWVWIHDVDGGQVRESTGVLAKYPTPPKATALYYAALCGFSMLLSYLIAMHAEDVNAKCGNHGTPLHAASYEGHLDAAWLLLYHGADVDATNELKRTPLCSAHSGGHLEVMRLLLDRGADVNVRYNPWGLLSHDASSHGQAEILHLLLQHNADVNARGSVKWTPLHWASKKGHAKVVKLLLQYGADVNAPSKVRNTPLLLASGHGRLEVVQILLEHGADVHTRGQFNWTAFQVAASKGYGEVAKLLLEYGAESGAERE